MSSNSASISAGNSVKLNFRYNIYRFDIHSKTISGLKYINGYHTIKDGYVYICLPDGMSIPGVEQVKIYSDTTYFSHDVVKSVKRLDDTKCKVNGITAYWWEISLGCIRSLNPDYSSIPFSIDIATKESMQNVMWNFNNYCIVIRAKGQENRESSYNTKTTLTKLNQPQINSLSEYFKNDAEPLGLSIYHPTDGSTILTVARSEAKLDVSTSLESADSGNTTKISAPAESIDYTTTISCIDGGEAKDFNYYIPVVKKNSTLDTSALVVKNEIGLNLQKEIVIKDANTGEIVNSANSPFEVTYTSQTDLNSTTIQGENVKWVSSPLNFDSVSAIRISAKDSIAIENGESYQFIVSFIYDNSNNDFDSTAGQMASWRSFGHYTYIRNGSTTTNSYPSTTNSIKVYCWKDYRNTPMALNIDTGSDKNYTDTYQTIPIQFIKEQNIDIKNVRVSSGTQLVNESVDVSNLTGAEANSEYKISFNINDAAATTLPNKNKGWTLKANKTFDLQSLVHFSNALTDTTTERYVDVTIGNDDINIICRIRLVRKVAVASADKSGVAVGEQFQVPAVSSNCTISKDSAFTALYVIDNFIPGNYSNQTISWQKAGAVTSFPAGITITMLPISDSGVTNGTDCWYIRPTGSSVNLNQFAHINGTQKFSYDQASTTSKSLKYLFIINFEQAAPKEGEYQLVFNAEAKTGVTAVTPVKLSVTLGTPKDYSLTSISESASLQPEASITYTVKDSVGNDSYTEGKTLSLVMKPNEKLPSDTAISVDGTAYTLNEQGVFIIPLGTVESGSRQFLLQSNMFPDVAKQYTFETSLYLANSQQDESPLNGVKLAACTSSFNKSECIKPSLKVDGTQVADISGWIQGQSINLEMENVPNGGSVMVTAYYGLNGNKKTTDLLSSVAGSFDLKDGVGTYNGKTGNGKLILNGSAEIGTYHLVFDVKDSDGNIVLSVPYYVVIRE